LPRLAAAEGAIAAYADIAGENRQLLEAPAAPAATVERRSNAVDLAAFQAAWRTMAGAEAEADAAPFSLVAEDPGASLPVPSSVEADIGLQNRPGSRCVWSQRAQFA
jgi:hypothetical protein